MGVIRIPRYGVSSGTCVSQLPAVSEDHACPRLTDTKLVLLDFYDLVAHTRPMELLT
jgi:hypothetical protein